MEYFTIQKNCEHELLKEIAKTLQKEKSYKTKIYFSGEYDSNQTLFESLSNQLEIGVLAPNRKTGLVLLRFLRIIIDNYPKLLMEDVMERYNEEDECEVLEYGSKIKMAEIIKEISKKEKHYLSEFHLTDELKTNFVGGENVTKRLDEIDVWTLPRIMAAIDSSY